MECYGYMSVNPDSPMKIEPIHIGVTRTGMPTATIYASGPSFDTSIFNNKRLTRATFTYRMAGDGLNKIIRDSTTVNVEYKLSNGTTISMNDVKFVPETSTGTSENIRILPATAAETAAVAHHDHTEPTLRIDEPTEPFNRWISLREIPTTGIPPPVIYESGKLYHHDGNQWLPVGEVKNNPSKEKEEEDTDTFSISEQMKKVD